MKRIVEWCKGHHKRIVALSVAFALICTSLWIPEGDKTVHAEEKEIGFESLYHTMQKGSVTAVTGHNQLGSLSNRSKGFAFEMTSPTANGSRKFIKIGLYNTTENNVWSGGYILRLQEPENEGELGWCVCRATDEAAFQFDTLTGLTGDKFLIETWLTDINEEAGTHMFHVAINGTEIFSVQNDGSIATGLVMGAYNQWGQPVEFKAVQTNDVPDEGVHFDNLGASSISVSKGNTLDIGKVASTNRGFQFEMSRPEDGADYHDIKLGLYNSSAGYGPWNNGYIVWLRKGSNDGDVIWSVRCGSNEGIVVNGGYTLEDVPENFKVSAWVSETGGTYQLNLIINGIRVLTGGVPQGTIDLVLGNFMTIYNGQDNTIALSDATTTNGTPDADVSFKNINDTLSKKAFTIATSGEVKLGNVGGTGNGFQFNITTPTTSQAMKIGLFNTNVNPWYDGYILELKQGANIGTVIWRLTCPDNETLLTYGEIVDAGEELEAYAWLDSSNGVHIIVNGKKIATSIVNVKKTVGPYMNIWHPGDQETIFKSNAEEDKPDGWVTFDNLGASAISVENGAYPDLGKVAEIDRGFRFQVSRLEAGEMKIGLFNTEPKNGPWRGGYCLWLQKGTNVGEINWSVRCGSNENVIIDGGYTLTGVPKNFSVYTWLSETDGIYKLNLIINGMRVLTNGEPSNMTYTVEVGTYMTVYNGQGSVATFTEISETGATPDAGIVLEDLGQMTKQNVVRPNNGTTVSLGNVSAIEKGFQFKVTAPTSGRMKVGLYNNTVNPWDGGYMLELASGTTSGSAKWTLYGRPDETVLTYGELTNVSESMLVSVWLDSEKGLHIIIDSKKIVSSVCVNPNGQGTKMSVYDECGNDIAIETITIVYDKPDEGVVFEDLGQMTGKNQVEVTAATSASLGKLSSLQKGFQFRVSRPTSSAPIKLGLYNTSAGDPWSDGYMVGLMQGSREGTVKWNLFALINREQTLMAFDDTDIEVPEDVMVYVWLTEVEGVQKLNMIIEGHRIITTASYPSAIVGNYMSVYNEETATHTFKTITEVYSDFAVNNINQSNYDISSNEWKIYLNTDVSVLGTEGLTYPCVITIDGVDYETTLTKASGEAGNLVYLTIPSDRIPQNLTKDYEVIVKAQQTANGEYSVQLTEDYKLYVREDGRVLNVTYPYAEDSDVLGDNNGDAETNSKDLIRIKKYLAGIALVNNQADLTIADNETIDEKDVKILRDILLDLDVKSDSYIALGEPSYDVYDEMRIAAFMGPRSAGKNDYVATLNKETWSGLYGYSTDIASVTPTSINQSYLNDYEFAQFADAGFNMVIAEGDAGYYLGNDASATKEYLTLAKNHGVDVILTAGNLADYLRGEANAKSASEVKQELAAMISDLGSYENFKGIQMADEISADAVNRRNEIREFVRGTLGRDDLLTFTNMGYHDSATTQSLVQNIGAVDGVYEYGYYPFQKERVKRIFQTSGEWKNTFAQEKWFSLLSETATYAKDSRVPQLGLTIQSCGYLHPVSVNDPSRRDIVRKADIGFQVYTALAYGVKSLNYFSYWEHYTQSTNEYFTSAMVLYGENGEVSKTTPTYDYVKEVNDELKKMDHVLLDYEWKGTINVGSTSGVGSSYTAASNSRIDSIANTSGQAVVGCMKDSEGFDGYMIANTGNPENGAVTTGTITFNNATRAIVYVKGEPQNVDLVNGSYTWQIGLGDGVFIIPLVK